MYAGKLVEVGDVAEVYKKPLHPYTQGLIAAFPDILGPRILPKAIPGNPPSLISPPSGCHFHPRCPYAMEVCSRVEPEYFQASRGHWTSCHLVKPPT
jgi:peptide/nickel transport system ATP-binding protein